MKIRKMLNWCLCIAVFTLLICGVNVYAEESNMTVLDDDPAIVLGGEIGILDITRDMGLNVYSIKEVTKTEQDEAVTSTVTYDEYTLVGGCQIGPSIEVKNFKIFDTDNGTRVYYVDVSEYMSSAINNSKDYVSSALELNEGEQYLFEITFNYKISTYPSKYKYVYEYDPHAMINDYFKNESTTFPLIDLTKEYNQVINRGYVYKKDGEVYFDYIEEVTDENKDDAWYNVNFMMFSTAEISSWTDEVDPKNTAVFMFGGIKGTEKIFESDDDSVGGLGSTGGLTEQVVSVADTDASGSMYVIIIGIISILSGLVICGKVLNSNKA